MASPTNTPLRDTTVERVNVNLPRPLLDDLRRLVPRSRRSEVIARATARELRRLKLAALFQDLARDPAWHIQEHAALGTGPAIDGMVNRMRSHGSWPIPEPTPRRRASRE